VEESCHEAWRFELGLWWVWIVNPHLLGTEIHAVAKADLCSELSISLGVQSLDQSEQGDILCWVRLCAYAGGFIPQDRSIALPCPLEFDRATEAALPMIEPGELMPVETILPHTASQI